MNGYSHSASLNKPRVEITEQPAPKALRFRYECEGRSAGSIPGVHSTSENRTYPTIRIVGYNGEEDIVIIVSCVTKNQPYLAHPHNLVGKDCKEGVCSVPLDKESKIATFSNLGIQCVKKRDIEAALRLRQEKKVDPFGNGFEHMNNPSSIDLNCVRLCFQAIVKGPQPRLLGRAVSDPVYDKKAMSDLLIIRLSHASASVRGGLEMMLLCEKITKEDIKVRFYEESQGHEVWEAFADIILVHKQVAIAFKTPAYHNQEAHDKVSVFMQLFRPSDKAASEPVQFHFTPDSGYYPSKRPPGFHPPTKRARNADDVSTSPASPYHNQNAYSPAGTPGPSEQIQYVQTIPGPSSALPGFGETWDQTKLIGFNNPSGGGTFTVPNTQPFPPTTCTSNFTTNPQPFQPTNSCTANILSEFLKIDSAYSNPANAQSNLNDPLNQYGNVMTPINYDDPNNTSVAMASVEQIVDKNELFSALGAATNTDALVPNEAQQQLCENFSNSMNISGDFPTTNSSTGLTNLVNETYENKFYQRK
ncbi:embryonic polarity protein dorsal-like isoform X3 [Planococcus citri]|uniref:embryonic polarity protein dorsal-like isoform X3 n=1 Tax=Planococcus citri TaxID=170843 RepID=UPI0031F76866